MARPCRPRPLPGEGACPRGQPVDASGQDRLHGRRHPHRLQGFGQPVSAAGAGQHAGLGKLADALLDKQGVALGARGEERLERRQRRVPAE